MPFQHFFSLNNKKCHSTLLLMMCLTKKLIVFGLKFFLLSRLCAPFKMGQLFTRDVEEAAEYFNVRLLRIRAIETEENRFVAPLATYDSSPRVRRPNPRARGPHYEAAADLPPAYDSLSDPPPTYDSVVESSSRVLPQPQNRVLPQPSRDTWRYTFTHSERRKQMWASRFSVIFFKVIFTDKVMHQFRKRIPRANKSVKIARRNGNSLASFYLCYFCANFIYCYFSNCLFLYQSWYCSGNFWINRYCKSATIV